MSPGPTVDPRGRFPPRLGVPRPPIRGARGGVGHTTRWVRGPRVGRRGMVRGPRSGVPGPGSFGEGVRGWVGVGIGEEKERFLEAPKNFESWGRVGVTGAVASLPEPPSLFPHPSKRVRPCRVRRSHLKT